MIKKFEFLQHTSDLKIRTRGKSKEEVIENLVLGISEYISSGNNEKNNLDKKIKISGKDLNEKVYKFIEEILFLLETESFLAKRASVSINDGEIVALLKGHRITGRDFAMIKAPTYSDMSIKKVKGSWILDVVLDI